MILKLQGSQLPDSSQLQQYSINCEEEDKFLLIYTLLKLRLVQGKTLLFVGTVDRSYRLKLFLEQFGIPACVLNSELPVGSRWGNPLGVAAGVQRTHVSRGHSKTFAPPLCRCHIISQFNLGFYDYIIAADEESLAVPAADAASAEAAAGKGKKKKTVEKAGKWVSWDLETGHFLQFSCQGVCYN